MYLGRVVVVNSFLFVLGTNGRMQPVVMAQVYLGRVPAT